MAASYHVVTQNRSVKVIGPTEVIDVEQVGIVTQPTGIFVEYGMPLELWQTRAGFDLLGAIASGIEQQISEGLAVGGSYVQDYDANNLLVDYCEFVVEYRPKDGRPPQRTTVLVTLESLGAAQSDVWFVGLATSPQSLLLAAYDTLVATAGA